MKSSLIVFVLFINFSYFSQPSSNKFSIDFNVGLNKIIYPETKGFYTGILNPVCSSLGVRYMMNDRFGIKGEFSYNYFTFKNDTQNLNDTNWIFNSYYYRTSLVGVTNLGNVLNFKQKTNKFGLLLHTGMGFSILQSIRTVKKYEWKNDYSDIMINLIVGLSPQYKINRKLAVNFDLLLISHLFQTFAFDMNSSAKRPGFDGVLLTISGGISYYIGKGSEHIDWIKKN